MGLELLLKDSETISQLRQSLFGSYLDEYADWLRACEYNNDVANLHIRLIADFSRWMKRNGISVSELSVEFVPRYVRYRRARQQPHGCEASAPKRFIYFLQERKVIPQTKIQQSACDHVVEDFVSYLVHERALSPATIDYYSEFSRAFVLNRFDTKHADLPSLCAADVLQYVQEQVTKDDRKTRAKLMITALRSFFRYLHYKGLTDSNLALVVPSVAQWSKASLPKFISSEQVESVISSRKGDRATDRRDYAIFLLLARLGLRAGEVVALTLEDVDWNQGCITIRGKGRSCTKMPLPADVGEAMAAYLQDARPASKLRTVFLSARAPIRGMTVSGLSTRVHYVLDALGIEAPKRGAHLFRHSLATGMLRGGASLAEIGELLRHRSTHTTEIYAKVDLASLRQLALPWPGGAQ